MSDWIKDWQTMRFIDQNGETLAAAFGQSFNVTESEAHLLDQWLYTQTKTQAYALELSHESDPNEWVHGLLMEYEWFLWDLLKERTYDVSEYGLLLSKEEQKKFIRTHWLWTHAEHFICDAVIENQLGMPSGVRLRWLDELSWMIHSLGKETIKRQSETDKEKSWIAWTDELDRRLLLLSKKNMMFNSNWMELLTHEFALCIAEQLDGQWQHSQASAFDAIFQKQWTLDRFFTMMLTADLMPNRPNMLTFKRIARRAFDLHLKNI